MIKNAFQCFDEDNSGTISEDVLREQLTTKGDRYTHEQVLLTFTFFKCVAISNGSVRDTRYFNKIFSHLAVGAFRNFQSRKLSTRGFGKLATAREKNSR